MKVSPTPLTVVIRLETDPFPALGWLEYCNSDRNTYYANLRRKNGREKPYNVNCPPP